MTVPTVLDERYELGELLGRGGMGAVYAGRDRTLGRPVAAKILDISGAPGPALERFRREARFLAGLSHPNVVTVFDFGADGQRAWLVMELLPGPALSDLLAERGPLPVRDVARYGRDAAAGLAAAHAAGVVHRDVKPGNLMLAADGRCKLVDLGIARLAGAGAATQAALTDTGTIVGSAPYVAPELISGGVVGPAADLYGLGCVLYTLLAGRPPFAAEVPVATLGQHLHAPAPRIADVRADVPPALDELVAGLLAKAPGDRPAATEVGDRLAALLPVVPDGPPAFGPSARTAALTGPAAGAAATAPLAAAAAGAALAGEPTARLASGPPTARLPRPDGAAGVLAADREPPGGRRPGAPGWWPLAVLGVLLAAALAAALFWVLSGSPSRHPGRPAPATSAPPPAPTTSAAPTRATTSAAPPTTSAPPPPTTSAAPPTTSAPPPSPSLAPTSPTLPAPTTRVPPPTTAVAAAQSAPPATSTPAPTASAS